MEHSFDINIAKEYGIVPAFSRKQKTPADLTDVICVLYWKIKQSYRLYLYYKSAKINCQIIKLCLQ